MKIDTIDIDRFKQIVFFTGAGMSAESGVPTYRGKKVFGESIIGKNMPARKRGKHTLKKCSIFMTYVERKH